MRELDAVLSQFLERHGASLTAADIATFERILDLPDPELHAYLVGRSVPADSVTAAFIARIRGHRL